MRVLNSRARSRATVSLERARKKVEALRNSGQTSQADLQSLLKQLTESLRETKPEYFKQVPGVSQVGARTETTVNNPRDFYLGKRLGNLPALRQVGFQANRRLLEVERLSHDTAPGEETMQN